MNIAELDTHTACISVFDVYVYRLVGQVNEMEFDKMCHHPLGKYFCVIFSKIVSLI